MSGVRWVDRLLGDVPLETFRTQYWERQAVLIKGTPDRFAELEFSMESFIRAACRTLPSGQAPLTRAQFHKDGRHRELLVRGDQIRELYDAGLTSCVWDLHALHPKLQELTNACKRAWQYPGAVYVNGYLSPAGGGFGIHFDRQSVMVLQLEGTKKWRYSRTPGVAAPPVSLEGTPAPLSFFRARFPEISFDVPKESEMEEIELHPGDVFYMPGGTWHRPKADDHSLALSLSWGPTQFSNLAGKALTTVGEGRLAWRQFLPPGFALPAGPSGVPAHVEGFFEERLAELKAHVNAMTVADLTRLWKAELSAPDDAPPQVDVEVSRDTALSHTAPLHWQNIPNAEGIRTLILHWGKNSATLPVETERFLTDLVKHRTFVAADAIRWDDAPEGLAWDEVKDALEALVSLGALTVRR